jgi:pimeloyl-ACP methyl ester carboxylesterase
MVDQTMLVNGCNIHYRMEGAGPDVIFLHGWASSSKMWSGLTPRLAARYRCWSLDLPGFGDSDKPAPAWYSIPNYTLMVLEFARLHGLAALRLVGHSMGGLISLDLGARHSEQVERLVAINPVITGRPRLRPLARPGYSRNFLEWALRVSPPVMQPLLAHPLGYRVNGLHPIRRRTEEFFKSTADSLLSSGRAIIGYDLTLLLPRIQAPTLIIVGDRDTNVSSREGRFAAGRIRGARLQVMHAGHLLTDDRPAEVLQLLERHLA